MPENQNKLIRIIDANLNRCREGLRVVEDLVRFILDDRDLVSKIKHLRHEVTAIGKRLPMDELSLLMSRDSSSDVGSSIESKTETTRSDILQIAMANIRRAEESARVLEEICKLYDETIALEFKRVRFKLYDIETQVVLKLSEYQRQLTGQ